MTKTTPKRQYVFGFEDLVSFFSSVLVYANIADWGAGSKRNPAIYN
jgi:hypothetical protein